MQWRIYKGAPPAQPPLYWKAISRFWEIETCREGENLKISAPLMQSAVVTD